MDGPLAKMVLLFVQEAQASNEEDPGRLLYCASWQPLQAVAPSTSLYLPTGQRAQRPLAWPKEPTGHGMHAAAASDGAAEPKGQVAHADMLAFA